MTLLDQTFTFIEKNSRSHIRLPFQVPEGYRQIVVNLKYHPTYIDRQYSDQLVDDVVKRFVPLKLQTPEYLTWTDEVRVRNIMTLSVAKGNRFIGAYHNKKNVQKVILSPEYSSLGFLLLERVSGSYELTLSLHIVHSVVNCEVSIEALEVL